MSESPDPSDEATCALEQDLWLLPGPPEDEQDFLPPGPKSEPSEATLVDDLKQAEAELAARLEHVAGKLGTLNDRRLRGPEAWRLRCCADLTRYDRCPKVFQSAVALAATVLFWF